jgi:HlyD family secretion protein
MNRMIAGIAALKGQIATAMIPPAAKRSAAAVLLGAVGLLSGCSGNEAGYLGSGTVEVREILVSAQVGGTIVELPAQEGSRVEQDDLLAQIDSTEPRLQLAQAEARREGAQAQLELLLAGVPEEDVRQFREQAAQARERLDLARKEAERFRELAAAGSATPSQLDQAETKLATAQAGFKAAQAALDKAVAPARPAELQLANARVREAESAVELAQLRVRDTEVRAPFAGVVTEKIHDVGELVAPGTPLLQLADLQTAYLTAYVSEPLLSGIHQGEELIVIVDGPRNAPYRGTVVHIAEQAEFTPSTVQTAEERARLVYAVKLRLENQSEELKAGMTADVYHSSEAKQ